MCLALLVALTSSTAGLADPVQIDFSTVPVNHGYGLNDPIQVGCIRGNPFDCEVNGYSVGAVPDWYPPQEAIPSPSGGLLYYYGFQMNIGFKNHPNFFSFDVANIFPGSQCVYSYPSRVSATAFVSDTSSGFKINPVTMDGQHFEFSHTDGLNAVMIYVGCYAPLGSSLSNEPIWITNAFVDFGNQIDLSVSQPQVSQLNATISRDDGLLHVKPNTAVIVNVPVRGQGIDPTDARSVAVSLKAGSQEIPPKYVRLAQIGANGTTTVPFDITFQPDEAGVQTITATVNSDKAISESYLMNNQASVQVNVDSGLKLQLAADFPDLPNDPSYDQNLSGTTQSMQVPLGAKFNLQLNRLDASGTPTELNSKYSMTSQNISPAISNSDGPTLFPNNVLVEDNDSVPGEQKLFQAYHMGNATIKITPTDPAYSSQNVTVNVSVYDPGAVGQSEPTPDDLIVKYAHKRGLPPQLIKAQIRQEGFVKRINSISERAFKYEPGYDNTYVEYSTKWHPTAIVEDPKYMPVEIRLDSGDNSIRQSILWPTDIDPRSMYDMKDPATKAVPDPEPRTITPSDVGITAANYINSNDSFPDSLFDNGDFKFTAQTTVSSSYGLLQIMYLTAVDEEKWKSPSGEKHPSELFIPEENISVGTRHLARQVEFPFDDETPSGISLSQINPSFDDALQSYNGGRIKDYFSLVNGFVPKYTPNNVKPVFTSGQ